MARPLRLFALWMILLVLASLLPLDLLPTIYVRRIYSFTIPYMVVCVVVTLSAFTLLVIPRVPRLLGLAALVLPLAWGYALYPWPSSDDGALGLWIYVVGPMSFLAAFLGWRVAMAFEPGAIQRPSPSGPAA